MLKCSKQDSMMKKISEIIIVRHEVLKTVKNPMLIVSMILSHEIKLPMIWE